MPLSAHRRRPRRLAFRDAPALARAMHKLQAVIVPATPDKVALDIHHHGADPRTGGEWLLVERDTGMTRGCFSDELVEELVEMEWVCDGSDDEAEEVIWCLSARGRHMAFRLRPIPTTSNDHRIAASAHPQERSPA